MPPIEPLDVAEKARLAHRVLRLKENGIDADHRLAQIADLAVPGAHALALAEQKAGASPDQVVGAIGGPAHALANTAFKIVQTLDPDQDGPTDDEGYIHGLFKMSHEDIWKTWKDASDEYIETIWTPDQVKEVRESQARDQAAYEERVALMLESGDWPTHPVYGHNRAPNLANALYDLGREGFLDATIDWDTANTKVALVDSAVYTVNLATHQFMSSVGTPVAATAAQTSKTKAAGVADAADDTFSAVTGATSEALVIYQASAVTGGADVANTLQRVIAYIDTATGLPVTPNGGNITVTWDNAANRIFKL